MAKEHRSAARTDSSSLSVPGGATANSGWLKIGAGEVVAIAPDGTRRTVINYREFPSGLGFLPDGTPLVVSVGNGA